MALTKIGKEGVTGISNSSNATAITIDSSENVGIGTSSPGSKLNVISATSGGIAIAQGTENFYGASSHRFFTDGYASEVLRINSSGNVLAGTVNGNPGYGNTATGVSITSNGTSSFSRSGADYTITVNNNTGAPYYLIAFRALGGGVGSISSNGSSTAYNTTSDYRLKENVVADWDATTRLKQLNPVRFNFIADANTTVDGFLAHEVQTVVPEAITGTHDEVDDEGNPVYQGIDQSKLVPLLVKTIQELEARIAALENA